MRWWLVHALAFSVILSQGSVADDDDDEAQQWRDEDAFPGEAYGEDEAAASTAVYIMEHGILEQGQPKWLPRGTLLLSGAPGRGFEARLSDAKEFVELRPELPPMVTEAASTNKFYAIRMYSPANPRRFLQASIPAKYLADHFEDWHDLLEVAVASTGVPVSLSYRVRHTLGLSLFEHTQVHLSEPSANPGPWVPKGGARSGGGGGGSSGSGGDGQQGTQSFLRRYWWVIIIGLLLLSSASDDGGSGGKAGGGGSGGGSSGGGGGRRGG